MNITFFWDWFSSNEALLYDKEAKEATKEIQRHLSHIDNDIFIEIGVYKPTKRTLTISANGNIDKFPLVIEAAKSAPMLSKWEVVAFRQAVKYDFTMNFGDLVLNPVDMKFVGYEDDGKLDIIVYGREFNKFESEEIAEPCFVLLDKLVGEYASTTLIRYLDIRDRGDLHESGSALTLTKLPQFLKDFFEEKGMKLN